MQGQTEIEKEIIKARLKALEPHLMREKRYQERRKRLAEMLRVIRSSRTDTPPPARVDIRSAVHRFATHLTIPSDTDAPKG